MHLIGFWLIRSWRDGRLTFGLGGLWAGLSEGEGDHELHLGAEFESAAELGQEITVSVAKHALSNLIEIVQKDWLQTHA